MTDRVSRLRATFQQHVFDALCRHGHWVYDPLTRAVFGAEWNHWRQTALPYVPLRPSLALGCGTGHLLRPLAARSDSTVVGLDRASSMLRAAAGQIASHGRVTLVRADARSLPFRDRSIASCVSTFPAPFILEETTLDEVVRVLMPGGTLLIVLSGYLRHPPIRRLPIGFALRLFYRTDPAGSPTWPPDVLVHPAPNGRLVDVRTPWGGARLWLARAEHPAEVPTA